jgi:hypothetical protein
MSHLFKEYKILKKIINYSFSILIIFTILFTTINYDGNRFFIFIYGILINLILINGLKKNSYFFEFFFGIFLWLGFWLKLIFIFNYYNYSFLEGAGYVYENYNLNKITLIDETLVISILAFSSYLLAVIYKDIFFKKKIMSNPASLKENKNKLFYKIQNILIILFIFLIIFTAFFNLDNLIYQRGMKSQSNFNFLINGTIKWVLLFGFSSIISIFILINLNNKIKLYQISIIGILEAFLSSVSYLSRGMIFNTLSIFYGLYKTNKIHSLNLKPRFFIIYFITIFIIFFISVSSINYLRHNYYFYNEVVNKDQKLNVFDKEDKRNIEKQEKNIGGKKYDTLERAINEFFYLAVNRWVGIDAVLSTVANENKNWNTFTNSFREKYDASKLPYYERVIQKRAAKPNELIINYGITTPGIVSFLFYSGSKIFLILSFFILTLVMLFFERILTNKTTNLIFCALIMQQISYRLIHFGYMPLNSYMFFGTIILTVLIHQMLLYLYKNINL